MQDKDTPGAKVEKVYCAVSTFSQISSEKKEQEKPKREKILLIMHAKCKHLN